MFRFRRRPYAWFAILAILIGALAPAVSRALPVERGTAFVLELCSATGTHRVWLSAAEAGRYAGAVPQDSGRPDADAGRSCPCCITHGAGFGLPPDDGPPAFVSFSAADVEPCRFLVAPHPSFAWMPSRPRAPPAAA
ncbi:DUF2946 domain-containing protein [Thauera sinica]|uniref:DUF2946 domain-containing protein n=1 Tax=Thauera sinica TaxID=2665146 RepID=A0ABW1APV5_9RHOO|nr:DUF2946 domain-containing protein [Thauera sp. K11]ATE59544.1 hypothetical protein CCZ27_05900 [Thauera sp. K11]